ncbi:uncharacterized protein LOC135935554 isoform X2 [Cloeon dipterum]|uniref:uncharacterized protein LOC135935554 isoform X2 n=1 Tax=Cloeon dipterum TaxID=197152 RepID=UPI00321F9355
MLLPETMTIDERQRSTLLENGHSTAIGIDEREEIAEDILRRTEHFHYKKMKTSCTIFKVFLFFSIVIVILAAGVGLGRLSSDSIITGGLQGCNESTNAPVNTTTAPVTTTTLETTIAPVTTTTPKQGLGSENKNITTDLFQANYTYIIASYYEYNKSQESSRQRCHVMNTSKDDEISVFVDDSQDSKNIDLAQLIKNATSKIFKCDSSGTCTHKCCTDCCQQTMYEEAYGDMCTFTNCKDNKREKEVKTFITSLIWVSSHLRADPCTIFLARP